MVGVADFETPLDTSSCCPRLLLHSNPIKTAFLLEVGGSHAMRASALNFYEVRIS